MVQTAVVPIKKQKMERHGSLSMDDVVTRRIHNYTFGGGLYGDLPPTSHEGHPAGPPSGATILGGLPLPFPNPAPEVNLAPDAPQPPVTLNPVPVTGPYPSEVLNEPRKKKYAKEAWPGKKPTPSLLI
ncbi:nuclear inhibitor of protein phosphatase 1-like isoform X3 [Oncorhynchus keta]|nr:nuclear inhibitor of protein phosphatase 1-like isoform X3 [Oncorhynchus keta]